MLAHVFAATFVALFIAHQLADHWFQTSHQACTKGRRDAAGVRACLAHVCTYTVVTALAVAGVWWALDLPISPAGFALGQLVSAVTHYWADRRFTLAALARLAGREEFYNFGAPRRVGAFVVDPTDRTETVLLEVLHYAVDERGRPAHPGGDPNRVIPLPQDNPSLGVGSYALDQSWHYLWLGVAALLTALIGV